MKPAIVSDDPSDDAAASSLGSEYMDARSYLAQPPRASDVDEPVQESDATFHGSNASHFGLTRIGPDE